MLFICNRLSKNPQIFGFEGKFLPFIDGSIIWLRDEKFLGRLYTEIPLSKLSSLELVHESRENGLNKLAEGKEHKFSRLPRGFPVFHT